jgi:hypothetical protein
MVDKLEACPNPWCEGEEGVTASQHIVTGKWHICCDDCMIDGPWADSHSAAIAAWNTRRTPANGEQVERDGIVTRTPTEDARERVKVLEEALDWAIAEIEGRTWYDPDIYTGREQRSNSLAKAKEALGDYVPPSLRTALGNKETDRHG